MDNKLKKVVSSIVKDFLNKYKRNPKDLKELAQFVLTQGGEKYIQRKTNEVLGKELTQQEELTPEQKLKALHGAKLNYLKSLKNQCAEDEEVVYYKKGGSVKCGCKKKEDGGEVVKAQDGAVAKFKNDLKKKLQQQLQQQQLQNSKWTDEKDKELKKLSEKKILTPQDKQKLQQLRNEFKKSSNAKDYELEEGKKGMKVEKDCGGAVARFKKFYRKGGSLNGIPFYLGGTSKGGVLYRFRRSTNNMNNGYKTYSDLIMMTQDPLGYPTYDTPPISAGRTIYVTPLGNDTIFYTNNDILNKTPKGDLNLKKAKLKFYQLIKKAPIEGEEYRMTPYWNSNLFNLDMVRNRALKGN